jgi:hypothetical protein
VNASFTAIGASACPGAFSSLTCVTAPVSLTSRSSHARAHVSASAASSHPIEVRLWLRRHGRWQHLVQLDHVGLGRRRDLPGERAIAVDVDERVVGAVERDAIRAVLAGDGELRTRHRHDVDLRPGRGLAVARDHGAAQLAAAVGDEAVQARLGGGGSRDQGEEHGDAHGASHATPHPRPAAETC